MRHNKLKKINISSKHRDLMFRTYIYSLILHGKVSTTISKFKLLKKIFDKFISKIKKNKTLFFNLIKIKNTKRVLFFLNRIKEKRSGYLKIKKAKDRLGDFSRIIYLTI
ncbi:L17 family ribosomal protein [Candidatus Vidania fulgoroideorum]